MSGQQEAKPRLPTILVAAAEGAETSGGDAAARGAVMETLAQRIAAHDGAVIRAEGWTMRASFDSPVEAVRCAIATQRAAAEDEADGRPLFRIGVDLGEAKSTGVEARADPGGICLSASVYEQIRGKIDLDAEGAPAAEMPAGPGGASSAWRIAPPQPGEAPAISIPTARAEPPPEPEPLAEEHRFPLLRVSLLVVVLAVAMAVYLVFLRTPPLQVEQQATPVAPAPAATPGRGAGPTLPGRPFLPEQAPFVDAADRARLRAEYMTAAPAKALAISRGNASVWYVHGLANADAAATAALGACQRNAPEPCELYAVGTELVWERPLPPVPPEPWLPAEGERVETPFDPALMPLAGPAMRHALQTEYLPQRGAKALALARSGTVGYVTRRPTDDDAVRAALEYCGDLTGTACAIVALGERFVVPIPAAMRATGLFRPEPQRPFSDQDYKRLSEQYLRAGGWKAVALSHDGRMGLSHGKAAEQDAIDAALADCRAVKPPSTGPGGVAAAVLGTTQADCAIYALGIFTVEAK